MNMLRQTIVYLVVITALLSVSTVVFAQNPSIPVAVGEGEVLTLSSVLRVVIDVVNTLITIALVITIAMIVYAGFRMATAKADEKAFGEGKKTLINAIIGLTVMLGVGIIIRTIGNFAVNPTSILR